MLRARILARVGNPAAAVQDIDRALELDGSDPDILLFAAHLKQKAKPHIAHELGLQILGSTSTSSRHRKAALRFMDPAQIPFIVQTEMKVTDRITAVRWANQASALHERGSGDFEEMLGAAKSGDAVLFATDTYLDKPSEGSRTLSFDVAEQSFEIHVRSTKKAINGRIGRGTRHRGRPWIVIPVHDGGKALARCLASVLAELDQTPRARLVIVNDASKEKATARILSAALQHERVTIVRSPENLGFVGAVNLGLRSIGPGPVLLLNSDTYLPNGLLNRLVFHLKEDDIGTVTPLSNNAGSFSAPKARTGFEMPSESQLEQLSALAFKQNPRTSVEVMNGNGFAMLISERCLEETGFLSTDFQSGYYEEVDFCIRAATKGFRHIAAVDCFVGHVGATSFGPAKRRLVSDNYRTLIKKYPFYAQAYERYAQIDPLKDYCEALVDESDWEPKKIPDARDTEDTELRSIDVKDIPIFPVQGSFDSALERLHLRRIALLPQEALECVGQELRIGHEYHMVHDPDEGLQLFDQSDTVVDRLPLETVSSQDIEAFEDRLLELLNGTKDAA
ncbi:glycosyltransferase [Donghicola sp. XS_ASV15]